MSRIADRDRPAASGAAPAGETVRLHASCVQVGGQGVVLLGPSGSGKSDLALRLIDQGALLVADDQLLVERAGRQLVGRPAAALAGLIEARGVGLLRLAHCGSSPLGLVAELDSSGRIPRWPERRSHRLLGIELPHLWLDARAASAPAVVRLALLAERLS